MADFIYNVHRKDIVPLSSVATMWYSTSFTYKAMLVSTGYLDQSNREDQDYILDPAASSASLKAFEISTTTGYAQQTLLLSTANLSDALNELHVTGSTTITFAATSSGAAKVGGMAIFGEINASDSSGRRPVAFFDGGFPVTPNGGDILVNASTKGWVVHTTTS